MTKHKPEGNDNNSAREYDDAEEESTYGDYKERCGGEYQCGNDTEES
jgi:hypothetical protein